MPTPRKRPEDRLKVGRPTDYKPEFCQKVIEMGKRGLSIAEVACALDKVRSTLWEWEQSFPEFSIAMDKYRENAEAWWCKSGHQNIDNKQYNSALYNIQMQNRFGWNKKTEVSGTVTINHEQALKELE